MTTLVDLAASEAVAGVGAGDPLDDVTDGGTAGVLGPQPRTRASTTRAAGSRAYRTTRTFPSADEVNGSVRNPH
jgi:hypothetical protein